MTLDAHADRTELRLQLYRNGYVPLANKSKLCLVKGWSTIKVDEELIQSREWARSKAFMDTGLRCGDIVAIDIDIDDPDLLNRLLDEVIAEQIVEESVFVRIGRAPRELWVYRTQDKIGKRTTGHFSPKDSPDDFSGYAVEVLGAGCQFAAFGQRDETTAYTWPEESLLEHEYMDLPVITLAQVEALKDFCAAFFERNGLQRRSPGGGTDAGYTHAFDLTPDMVFDVKDMGEQSVEELTEILRANPEEVLRCKVDAFRPTSGSWAGMVSLVGGDVCISDHGTYTSHFLVENDLTARMSELGALLAERFPTTPAPTPDAEEHEFDLLTVLDPAKSLDDNLAVALKRFVYIEDGNTVHDIRRPLAGMTADHFRNRMRQFYEVKLGKMGGEVRTWLADQWFESSQRINVASIAMRPDQPWPLYSELGSVHLNTYRPQVFPDNFGDAGPGFEFIQRLLPIDAERTYFLQWLSYKFQHPDVRGPGIIMVANDRYGTGRGTLIKLLRGMFSAALVQNVDFKTLSGQTYQSQYNEWLADSLIVAVDEAQEVATTVSKWQARSNAYEHLKGIVDPANTQINVVRKGLRNSQGRTFASMLVMTNHMDALIIPAGDRRFAILENGATQTQEYWDGVHAWLAKPENIAAFVRDLVEVPLVGYSAYEPPPITAAKTEMIAAGSSEIDRAFDAAMAGFCDTLIVKEQVLLRIEDYLAATDAEVPDDWQRMIERMLQRRTRRVPEGVPERVRIEGKQRLVRLVGKVSPEGLQTAEAVIAEVLRNGSVIRAARSSGAVIQFPFRGAPGA